MIERGIEDFRDVPVGLDADLGQFFVPCGPGVSADLFEVPSMNLGAEVHPGSLRAYGGDADFYQQLLPFRRVEVQTCEKPVLSLPVVIFRSDES